MKIVRLATLTRILGITEKLPMTAMQKKLLRKTNKRKVKMSTFPKVNK